MGDRLPNTFGNHSSGWEEIALGNPLNLAAPFEAFFGTSVYGLVLQFLPPIYVALILVRLFMVSTSKTEVLWVSLVVIFPLGAAFFAGDYYRWIAMSANAGLLLILVLSDRNQKGHPVIDSWLLGFALLGPFGATPVERPFPVHQFILESLF